MKTVATILTTLLFAVGLVTADDSSPPPVSIETIISSFPKLVERHQWASYSEERRHSPEEAIIAEKMKNLNAKCKQLQSLLVKGKPLSDYPGLLALGDITWNKSLKRYTLTIYGDGGPIGYTSYLGFRCRFDQFFNIETVNSFS